MPLYEYRCRKCDKKIEVLVLSGEKAVCPHCQGQDLERLLSVFSPHGSSCPSDTSAGPGCGSDHNCSSCCRH
ncbi:MAG: zinc ribbon domain-containing protein [Elusimicrobia bacterium]|nr:zinc ribbon domain-containing protein [Elusimicrobiota bacterium]